MSEPIWATTVLLSVVLVLVCSCANTPIWATVVLLSVVLVLVFLPVIVQRLALMVLSVQKPVVLPQAQYLDKVVPFPLSTTGAYGLTVLKTAVSPQLQFVDVVVDISVVVQRQFYGPVQDHRASPVAVH